MGEDFYPLPDGSILNLCLLNQLISKEIFNPCKFRPIFKGIINELTNYVLDIDFEIRQII